ncbi:MAG: hypothetical protein PHS26_08840 [Actinomycetota bacterium]|nr:hypothetical protein [Actinomycetota bacterium]
MGDRECYQGVFEDKIGSELMVWTAGCHYFRGDLHEITADGLLIIKNVSCTLAGERHEREEVHVSLAAVDAIS